MRECVSGGATKRKWGARAIVVCRRRQMLGVCNWSRGRAGAAPTLLGRVLDRGRRRQMMSPGAGPRGRCMRARG